MKNATITLNVMEHWGPASYGDRIADIYDEETRVSPEPAVAFLAPLAAGGRVLELGIGTGRIALPLASQGIEVHGIDASQAMVEKLRAKPGGQDMPVTIGDFADVSVDGSFEVIFVAVSSFFALVTQEDQVRCFANVAAHLVSGGVFIVDAFVPDPGLFPQRQRVATHRVEADEVELIAGCHDRVSQRVRSAQVRLSEAGVRLYPMEIRYAWPAELDLMARLAGLGLRERVGGWNREPFTDESQAHISVYERT
ncbi:MAG: class I SAM-dependent methyltransferase [Actinobacteria bacterium]|nr:class I SAM-dependent methyltransferase [Actinomycetota bacterium]